MNSSFDLGPFPFHEETSSSKKPKEPEKFSWRLDPEESFSDWTIVLDVLTHPEDEDDDDDENKREADETTPIQTEFHVHKSYLAAGTRRSLYFQQVFSVSSHHQNNNNALLLEESLDATSRIPLEESAARAIPTFLDFMYSENDPLEVTTESAVALRWIASYFGVEPMFVQVNDFIHKDLAANNSSSSAHHHHRGTGGNCFLTYLQEAAIYCDEKVAQAACKVCAKKFGKLKVEDMVRLSPLQFSSIVEQAKISSPSDLMSNRVATYCDARRDDIAPEMLLKWTDPNYMNVINSKAAVSLLRHAEQAMMMGGGGGVASVARSTSSDDAATTEAHVDTTTSSTNHNNNPNAALMERCIEAASSNWQVALVENLRNPKEAQRSGFAALSVETRCRVLERALTNADDQLNDTKKRLETSQARISSLHAHVRFENVVVMATNGGMNAREEGAREGWSSITDESYDSDDSGLMTSA